WFYMLRASEYLPGIATESAPSSYHAAVSVPPVQESADEPLNTPQLFLPEQVFHSPSWRSALPPAVMADNAPRPAGMGHAQLREWIEQWGSAWAFLGLQPGSSMTDVMKAFKKKALVLHPDKVPESEKADATLRMSALGNAKEILLSPGLRRSATFVFGSTAPARTGAFEPTRPFVVIIFEGTATGSLLQFFMAESAGTAPPPDPFSGYDYTWFEKGKGKGPWRQKGRNVWEDPYGTVWEEMSGSTDFYDEDGFESDDSWELDSDSSGPQID
ncbi:CAJ1, partial [Symbiodinium sp. KB8]